MKSVLVVCPTPRDRRELGDKVLQSQYNILFYGYDDCAFEKIMCDGVGWLTYDFNPAHMVENIISFVQQNDIDGIICTEDYPGSILASIVAKKCGLRGPAPHVLIGHQHKYYSRDWQQQYVPEATPHFQLIDPKESSLINSVQLPVFLKPVNSSFSVFANEINTNDELIYWLEHALFPARFSEQFNWFLRWYSTIDLTANYFIAEEVLIGEQCTLEGFVNDGRVTILGVVDSIMFPGTICFKRFDYPSHLSPTVQDRMAKIASTLMLKTGFDNSFFNIEFMYNPQTDLIYIIEVNPRAVSQFADLYEKVDGTNSYPLLIQLALGEKLSTRLREGKYNVAASCILRVFENKRVVKSPGPREMENLYQDFPDARCQLFVKEGELLSDAPQDGKSYRYGLVHLGARDQQELQEKFERCKRILDFEFESV